MNFKARIRSYKDNDMRTAIFTIILALCLSTPVRAQPEKDNIVGQIFSEDDNSKMAYANIGIEGSTQGTSADLEGRFKLAGIPAGEHTIVISFLGFQTRKIKGVVVQEGAVTDLGAIGLASSAISLGEVVVSPGSYSINIGWASYRY